MNPWFAIVRDSVRLAVDAQTVVALRLARMAHGGQIDWAETQRMVVEKTEALAQVQLATAMTMLSGQRAPALARKTIDIYGKRVRANRRRLSRG